MLALLLALFVIFAWWAPDSWLGAALTRWTAKGVRWLAGVRPLTIICFIVVVAAFAGLIAYGQVEGLMMAGLAAPEVLMTFLVFDVGTAVELTVVAWLVAGRANFRSALQRLRSARNTLARLVSHRSRARRRRLARTKHQPSNDDEPGASVFERPLARAA